MNVYVAASSKEIDRAKRFVAMLTEAGVAVVSTWIANVEKVGEANPADASRGQRAMWAHQDLEEVLRADAMCLLMPQTQTSGAWIELGYAIGRQKLVYIAGPNQTRSIFTALGRCYETDEACAEAIIDSALDIPSWVGPEGYAVRREMAAQYPDTSGAMFKHQMERLKADPRAAPAFGVVTFGGGLTGVEPFSVGQLPHDRPDPDPALVYDVMRSLHERLREAGVADAVMQGSPSYIHVAVYRPERMYDGPDIVIDFDKHNAPREPYNVHIEGMHRRSMGLDDAVTTILAAVRPEKTTGPATEAAEPSST